MELERGFQWGEGLGIVEVVVGVDNGAAFWLGDGEPLVGFAGAGEDEAEVAGAITPSFFPAI